nr:putative ribonuclease H-like domain-containing protein [Tanacetum cinerariifolium]
GPKLDHEDLKQLDKFDPEEMDLKWNQLALTRTKLSASNTTIQGTLLENANQKEIKKVEGEMQETLDKKQETMRGELQNRMNLKLWLLLMEKAQPLRFQSILSQLETHGAGVSIEDANQKFLRFSWVFFLRTKDETSGILKDFIRQIENQLNQKVKTIRCDNGTKFKNGGFIELCASKGIKREYSNAKTPQQNGVAERKNRSLIENARTMLADSFLPKTFWAEAVSTVCYVLNRPITAKNKANKTACLKEANNIAGTPDNIDAGNSEMEAEHVQEYFVLPLWSSYTLTIKSSEAKNGDQNLNGDTAKEADDAAETLTKMFAQGIGDLFLQVGAAKASSTNYVNTASTPVNTASTPVNIASPLRNIPSLEDIYEVPNDGIFTSASYDAEGAVADFTNLDSTMTVSHIHLKFLEIQHQQFR